MKFAFIDPGALTGISIFNETLRPFAGGWLWQHLSTATVQYKNTLDYLNRLKAIINNYGIQFAVIEEYVNYGRKYKAAYKAYHQQAICQEVWLDHIIIPKKTWDPANMKPKAQRELLSYYGFDSDLDEHSRDTLCMAIRIFNRLPVNNEDKSLYLWARAQDEKTIGRLR